VCNEHNSSYIRYGQCALTRCKAPDRERTVLSKAACSEHASRLVDKLLCTSLYTGDPENKGWHKDVHNTMSFDRRADYETVSV
jgi:hypothetical protein